MGFLSEFGLEKKYRIHSNRDFSCHDGIYDRDWPILQARIQTDGQLAQFRFVDRNWETYTKQAFFERNLVGLADF